MQVSVYQIINSAKWAAYGDGLGFMTELADASGVKKRTGVERITKMMPWRRLVGGKFGVVMDLPEGCYSDDTQLRLATSRAIRGSGEFDVEAFAKVEIPVWLTYSLGAGRGTKIAANSLAKDSINWFSNFFDGDSGRYIDGGGNGAAMRIQPHVWAANSNNVFYLKDVIRNAISTHGHARGFLGAVFHAISLKQALEKKAYPGPEEWKEAVDLFATVPDLVHADSSLNTFWLPAWERLNGVSLSYAVNKIQAECVRDIDFIVSSLQVSEPSTTYRRLVEQLGGLDEKQRGSGTKTAILGTILPWLFQKEDPEEGVLEAANLLGSDTDTIATMAGAIIGAVIDAAPRGKIADEQYIESEAKRMYQIRRGGAAQSFPYPDVLKWLPPRAQLDAVGKAGESFYVAGLGRASPVGAEVSSRGKGDVVWQWMCLEFGQRILVKRRKELRPIQVENTSIPIQKQLLHDPSPRQISMFDQTATTQPPSRQQVKSVDTLTSEAIKQGFDPILIGVHLLELSDRDNGIELAIAYAAIIAKARAARALRRT